MTDKDTWTAEALKKRSLLADAIQEYVRCVYGPYVTTDFAITVEAVNPDMHKQLFLLTSERMASWNLVGQLMGGMQLASELIQNG